MGVGAYPENIERQENIDEIEREGRRELRKGDEDEVVVSPYFHAVPGGKIERWASASTRALEGPWPVLRVNRPVP